MGQILAQPVLLVQETDRAELLNRVNQMPFSKWYNQIKKDHEKGRHYEHLKNANFLPQMAFVAWLENDEKLAKETFHKALKLANDSITNSLSSFGLRRGQRLKNLAITYDFIAELLPADDQDQFADILLERAMQVSTSFGKEANYSIVSNWMGIRYGALMLAAMVLDGHVARSMEWEASKRLKEHLHANFHRGGWNAESLGYFHYAWTVAGPAMIAMENKYNIDWSSFAPLLEHSMHGMSIALIRTDDGSGIKPDLSDDNMVLNPISLMAISFRVFPQIQEKMKWIFDYMTANVENLNQDRLGALYAFLYYPKESDAVKPDDWKIFSDPFKGITLVRNQFKDESDIIFVHNGNMELHAGHKGPDANTIRLIGLGVPWIIGGGRTGWPEGQPGLFPENVDRYPYEPASLYSIDSLDRWIKTSIKGSHLGTNDHLRDTYISYHDQWGAAMTLIIKDSSANGYRWRLTVPEFLTVKPEKDGYLVQYKDGQSLRVRLLNPSFEGITTGAVRYGYQTIKGNPMIPYQGKVYENIRYIDMIIGKEATVIITLQQKGREHPKAQLRKDEIIINEHVFKLF